MSGNPDNASLWTDADVYIAASLLTADPANINTPFDTDWDLVGLLDGDDGFVEARDLQVDDFYAWGGLLVRTSRRNFTLTRKFSALEDNETVRSIVWPGSTETAIFVPDFSNRFRIAFETREGDATRRVISKNYAQVDEVADITDSESALTKYEITVKIYPDSDGQLFVVQNEEAS